jgi:hypothetical protein
MNLIHKVQDNRRYGFYGVLRRRGCIGSPATLFWRASQRGPDLYSDTESAGFFSNWVSVQQWECGVRAISVDRGTNDRVATQPPKLHLMSGGRRAGLGRRAKAERQGLSKSVRGAISEGLSRNRATRSFWRLGSCAIQGMKSTSASPPLRYIDATELAALLGLTLRTITLRAKHRPWLLPPRAELYDRELLRWRQDIVLKWLDANLSDALKF